MTSTRKYKVAHLRRTYLLKREPFIGYQVTSHVDFQSIVLCRERDVAGGYDSAPIYCSADQLGGASKMSADFLYNRLRVLSHREKEYLVDIIKKETPDILHCHYLPDARFFLDLKRATGLPLVVSAYGYDVSEFHRRLWGYGRMYLNPLLRLADAFIAMSPDMKNDLITLGCSPERVRVHYYGVETSLFHHPSRSYDSKEQLTVLVVAGLDEYKGHIWLLKAVETLMQRGRKDFVVRFVGHGVLEDELKRFVRTHGLDSVVQFAGFVSRDNGGIVREFQNADVFVMPSVTERSGLKEGIPGALVEAMASGLPCIATEHAGIPYVLTDEREGLLVPERDGPAIATNLERLFDDNNLRRTLGQASSARALREFDYKNQIRHLEAIYMSILKN